MKQLGQNILLEDATVQCFLIIFGHSLQYCSVFTFFLRRPSLLYHAGFQLTTSALYDTVPNTWPPFSQLLFECKEDKALSTYKINDTSIGSNGRFVAFAQSGTCPTCGACGYNGLRESHSPSGTKAWERWKRSSGFNIFKLLGCCITKPFVPCCPWCAGNSYGVSKLKPTVQMAFLPACVASEFPSFSTQSTGLSHRLPVSLVS